MLGAGWINCQGAGRKASVLVALGSGKHKDVLVALMAMERNFGGFAKTEERGRGAVNAVSIKTMDIDTFLERFPRDFVLPLGDAEEVVQFQALIGRRRIGLGKS